MYVVVLQLNFKELRHLKLTFDYKGPNAKADYTRAMRKLYNRYYLLSRTLSVCCQLLISFGDCCSVAKFALEEVKGTRKVTVAGDSVNVEGMCVRASQRAVKAFNHFLLAVDFKSSVTPKHVPVAVPLPVSGL